MAFKDAMEIMLPPVEAHITFNSDGSINDYDHPRDRNNDGDTTDDNDTHGGMDFNYTGGQGNGINTSQPVVNSPVRGKVINDPLKSSYGAVIIKDNNGYTHRILHLHSFYVSKGDAVNPGQKIGTMGGRGPNGPSHYDKHVHYQIHNKDGEKVDPEEFWKSTTDASNNLINIRNNNSTSNNRNIFTEYIKPRASCHHKETTLGRGTRRGSRRNDRIEISGSGNHKVDAGSGNDYVQTGSGNDTLKGRLDDDVLKGGSGDDIYVFDPGDGHDKIIEANSIRGFRVAKPDNDTLKFGKCISFDDIESHFDDNNLVINFKNTSGDSITIYDWIINSHRKPGTNSFQTVQRRIENFEFADGSTLTGNEFLNSLGTNDNDNIKWKESGLHINTKAGHDTIELGDFNNVVNAGQGNDSVKTGSGDDHLKGGADSDTLEGGDGNDTYYYKRGDGADLIIEAGDKLYTPNPGNDTLKFGASILLKNIESHFDNNDLIINFVDNSQDSIRLKNWKRTNQRIENFEFENGLKLNAGEFLSTLGTEENDFIDWSESGLKIKTRGGDDTIRLGAYYYIVDSGSDDDTIELVNGKGVFRLGGGNDTFTASSPAKYNNWIDAGPGRDKVTGGHGEDTIKGGSGRDILNGSYGNDTLIGGRDRDKLYGGADDDTYVYNLYDGFDTIYDNISKGNAGNDTLKLGPGITRKNTTSTMVDDDLIIRIGHHGMIKIKDHAKADNKIENIIFSDGSRLSSTDINDVIQGIAAHTQDKGIVSPDTDYANANVSLLSIVAPGLQAGA